jgi:hypothetical protein
MTAPVPTADPAWIQAVAEVLDRRHPEHLMNTLDATAALSAVLPLIADAIEAIPYSPELEHGDNGEWMQQTCAQLIRNGGRDV